MYLPIPVPSRNILHYTLYSTQLKTCKSLQIRSEDPIDTNRRAEPNFAKLEEKKEMNLDETKNHYWIPASPNPLLSCEIKHIRLNEGVETGGQPLVDSSMSPVFQRAPLGCRMSLVRVSRCSSKVCALCLVSGWNRSSSEQG